MREKLTNSVISTLKANRGKDGNLRPTHYTDGAGLDIVVMPNGTKRWESKTYRCGQRIRIGLGVWPEVSIKEARARHAELRAQARAGRDPRLPAQLSFGELFERWYQHGRAAWSDDHATQIRTHYQTYIAGKLGRVDVAAIQPQDVAAVFTGSLKAKRETARRVHSTISRTLRHGVATGVIASDPSRDISIYDILPPSHGKKHFAAVTEPAEMGWLMRDIWDYPHSPVVRVAMLLAAWTGRRTNEIVGARWEEINMKEATWIVPAGRMKRRTEHAVPLPRQAMELLRELQAAAGGSPWVLPSRRSKSGHLSDGAILSALRGMGWEVGQMTGHGFRTMFSTYANNVGDWNDKLPEAQLSHVDKNTVRGIYNRGEYLAKRRPLMQWYADELDRLRLGGVTDGAGGSKGAEGEAAGKEE